MITVDELRRLPRDERTGIAEMALGRIFCMGARTTESGDVEVYETCRILILEVAALEHASDPAMARDWVPNIARDRGKGGAGRW